MTASVVPLIQTTPSSLHTRVAMLYQNIASINENRKQMGNLNSTQWIFISDIYFLGLFVILIESITLYI